MPRAVNPGAIGSFLPTGPTDSLATCPRNLTVLPATEPDAFDWRLSPTSAWPSRAALLTTLCSLAHKIMVRLVFRPYTQVRKAICTSAHLRASTRVSSGFALLRHSSPSFGSQHTDSDAILSQKLMVGRGCGPQQPSPPSISLRLMGLPPTGSHACCTPWSVFQDGHIEGLLPASKGRSSRRTGAPRCLDRPDGMAGPIKGPLSPA